MPTHPDAFDLVAEALNGGEGGSAHFYERSLPKWPEPARELTFDFLVACSDRPSPAELESLINAVGTVSAPRRPATNVVAFDDVPARQVGRMSASAAPSRTGRAKPATGAKAPPRFRAAAPARTMANTGFAKRAATKAPAKRAAAGKTVGKSAKSPRNASGRPTAASPGSKGKPEGKKPRSPAR